MGKSTQRILAILRENRDFISGQDISDELGISRTAVWKCIEKLRDTGYTIDAVSNRGYRLLEGVDLPIADEIGLHLASDHLGKDIVFLETVDSTNNLAMMLASRGAAHGTVVTADMQTEGRGRKGRKWISPPGTNLYMSIILKPDVSPSEASQIPILSVIATLRALHELVPDLSLKIKWPNDIYCNGSKLSGTLCDMKAEIDRVNYIVVGIGINVNMKRSDSYFPDSATSLLLETGSMQSRVKLAALILEEFERIYGLWLEEGDLGRFIAEWEEHSLLMGQQVDVKSSAKIITGKAVGIEKNGAMKLQLPDGLLRYIYAGDATLHKSSSNT